MNLNPLSDLVIAELKKETEKKLSSGLIVVQDKKDVETTAEIVAVGPGARNTNGELIPMSVKVGDKVLYKKYAGTEHKEGDREYVILSEREILAIFNA